MQGQSDRKLPYPILFVHGWGGSDETWYAMLTQLKDQGVNVDVDYTQRRAGHGSRIEFDLNADNDLERSFLDRSKSGPVYGDVRDLMSYVNPNNDVFAINFDMERVGYSNQSGAVKQGFAVGLAVRKILNATKSEKIILFGHSMGGLAIREYLQNSLNWLTMDGNHHVAKLITTGTPHGGSNQSIANFTLFKGLDERSEAVRDLRYYTRPFMETGIYLNGGYEGNNSRYISDYFNKDVDCNGELNYVTGLNEKPIRGDLDFACIIGTGGTLPTQIGGISGSYDDDVVEGVRQNLGNYYNGLDPVIFEAKESELELRAKSFVDNDFTWHQKLSKLSFINLYALDEPNDKNLAFEIQPNKRYKGFFTPSPGGYVGADIDRYKIRFPQRGILEAFATSDKMVTMFLNDWNDKNISSNEGYMKGYIPESGDYQLVFSGNYDAVKSGIWNFSPYEYRTIFCPLPELPTIAAGKDISICSGQQVTLTLSNDGYESYTWYRDDQRIGTGRNINITQPGIYRVEGGKCGVSEKSVNEVSVTVRPAPARPVISLENGTLVSSANSGNQWHRDGRPLRGETGKSLASLGSGAYSVTATMEGCAATSETFVITSREGAELKRMVISPNPSADGNFEISVSIPAGSIDVTVTDLTGRIVAEHTANVVNGIIRENLQLPTGVYIVRAGKETGKVVVIR